MTYRDLLAFLGSLDNNQLDKTVTIYDFSVDDFFPIEGAEINFDESIIEKDQPILILNDSGYIL